MTNYIKKTIRFLKCTKEAYPEFREVIVNKKMFSSDEKILPFAYNDNAIITSRYTIWNFLFVNLFEQLQRISNYYFILSMIVNQLLDFPYDPFISVFPIMLFLLLTLIKQGIEDIVRHRSDKEVNDRRIDVLNGSQFIPVHSSNIRVGDVLRIKSAEAFPCDIIMLQSSNPSGECFVTTANLDGETSLKVQSCLECTQHIDFSSTDHPVTVITCIQPIEDLYIFNGHLEILNQDVPVSACLARKNLLLRGAVLRNTEFIVGTAVYTGKDTKLSLNSKSRATKFSQVDHRLNHYLITYFCILIIISLTCFTLLYVYRYNHAVIKNAWYLSIKNSTSWQATQEIISYILLYNSLIPLALYITIEMVKFFGSYFIRVDLDMYEDVGDNRARVNTSDLNEELGQITYLFSDKTGTLTENDMQFRMCSIRGTKYVDVDGQLCKMSLQENDWDERLLWPYPNEVIDFLIFLSVCHTVRVERLQAQMESSSADDDNFLSTDGADYVYQASSPDEKAFVEASRRYGIVFHGCTNGVHNVTVNGEIQRYKIREIFEFDSNRKCMSVIVDYPNGTTKLLSKGAESSILPKASKLSDSVPNDVIMDHLMEYAKNGLRTLVFGYKDLSKLEADVISERVKEFSKMLNDVDIYLSKLYSELETDLILVGCTGIEDRLQEGVHQTLEDMKNAGIKVWVLTGDKEETAINISYSSGHFPPNSHEVRMTKLNTLIETNSALETQLERIDKVGNVDSEATQCLIVDGKALQFLLEPALKGEFITLCMNVSAVLCCRMTPIQKAEIVSMIKLNVKPTPVTCAIGDGGNDVSMIQEAHIGVGIFGKEGRQAAIASDYAIGKFHFLRHLVLVHGHCFYSRLCYLILFFFYKNLVFIGPQFYFAFFNLYSGNFLYYDTLFAIYDVTFTSLPIMSFYLFEKVFPKDDLLSKPYLYKLNRNNEMLSNYQFIVWTMFGLWHSLIIFFGILLITSSNGSIGGSDGKENSLTFFGHTIFSSVWIIVCAKLYLMTRNFTTVTVIAFILALSNVFFIISLSFNDKLGGFYSIIIELYSQPSYWMIIFIIPMTALIPDIIYRLYCDKKHSDILRQKPMAKRMDIRRKSFIPSKKLSKHDDNENSYEDSIPQII